MASFVKAADAVAAAVEIERRGFLFYQKAAVGAKTPQAKEFFEFMSHEEKRHEGIFSSILKRMGGLELPTGSDDEEYLSYVRMLLDSHCLFMPETEGAAHRDPFLTAIGFEKDTIIFFLGLEHLVPDSERFHIKECIEEEKKHLRLLAAKRAAG